MNSGLREWCLPFKLALHPVLFMIFPIVRIARPVWRYWHRVRGFLPHPILTFSGFRMVIARVGYSHT